tara:strand:- start:464 stop:763 length:300 start_codon:yes stop_codon:yes gene_type:complete
MEQEKETIYLVELSQTEIESIISALDTVVKAHGISVAEKCGSLHRALIEKSNPKEELIEEPKEELEEEEEEVSLEEVEDELEQIMKVPKKKKRTTKKKK